MYYKLLLNTIISLAICSILVIISYYYIDKPLAEWIYQQTNWILQKQIRQWVIEITQILHLLGLVLIILIILKKTLSNNLSKLELTSLATIINLIVTDHIKDTLKLVFGRSNLIVYTKNIHAWLQNPQHGFHPFHGGAAYQSFPSGHTAAAFAIASIIWIAYPKWRWLCIISCLLIILCLLWFNYHFFSDIIAGAFLGTITGAYTSYLFILNK